MAVVGSYYCFDIPAATNTSLRAWLGVSYTEWQYELSLLYSVYSIPNIFLPFLGGILVDKLGASRTVLMFASLVLFGQILFAVGVSAKHFLTMLAGRTIFGAGCETLDITQMTIATEWFQNHPSLGLSLVLALNLSSVRASTALNDAFSPLIASRFGVASAPWVGTFVCVLSSSAVIGVVTMNSSRESAKIAKKNAQEESRIATASRNGNAVVQEDPAVVDNQLSQAHSTPPPLSFVSSATLSTPISSGTSAFSNYGSTLSPLGDAASDNDAVSVITSVEEMMDGYENQMEVIAACGGVGGLGAKFWILTCIVVASYGVVNPFFNVSTDFFQERFFPGNPEKAGLALAVPPTVTAILAPFLGILSDAYPTYRPLFLALSQGLLLSAHVILGWTMLTPFVGMAVLGCGYSLMATVLWPMLPEAVGDGLIATGYGLAVALLNTTLSLFPLVIGHIRASDPTTWKGVQTFFVGVSATGVLLCILLGLLEGSERSQDYNPQSEAERRPLLEN
ncbi:hypothetical protein HDU93_007459 [Gonapodya sp. JEL0774]|nr:hypothetical protein HDU93_007459 [Gonapodya sp. JEL0774]